ncbi:MAG TPA: hemerythrin domain-containing protein, partial [Chromatiaceae bacterium]|nr:hemerythrin domain-containing protein [Chromatiaceae bacterium]
MTTIDDLKKRRREITEMASVIDNLLNPEQLSIHPIAKVAHILLCDLCEMMSDHLADEHKGLYPNLLTHQDTRVKNLAWGLINNDKLLKPEFSQYKRKWLKDCEFQFTEEFVEDT